MKNLKLIIFDLDGVLVDACEWHRVALNKALKKVCNYEISLDDHMQIFNGIPTKVKLKKLTALGKIDASQHEEVYRLKQKITKNIIRKQSKIRNEKIEMINHLKEKGLKVCCFTNSIRETADLMLKTSGVFDLLDMIVTNQDVKNAKPDPEGYLKILSCFNIPANDAIIVEDSPKGIEAAILSGCKVIGVLNADHVTLEIFEEFLK